MIARLAQVLLGHVTYRYTRTHTLLIGPVPHLPPSFTSLIPPSSTSLLPPPPLSTYSLLPLPLHRLPPPSGNYTVRIEATSERAGLNQVKVYGVYEQPPPPHRKPGTVAASGRPPPPTTLPSVLNVEAEAEAARPQPLRKPQANRQQPLLAPDSGIPD